VYVLKRKLGRVVSGREVAHDTSSVAGMQDPTNAFGESVAGVDDTGDVLKDNVASALPILDREELNVDMAGPFGRAASVHHFNSGFVVFIEGSRAVLREAKLGKDEAEVFGHFGSGNGRDKFCLSGTSRGDRLGFTPIGNGTTGEGKNISSGRSAEAKIIGVRGIHIAGELERVQEARETGEGSRVVGLRQRNMGERGDRSSTPELDTPIDSIAEILGDILETKKMDAGGLFRKFSEGGDGVADVRACSDVGVK
jgi:hypothetical protein